MTSTDRRTMDQPTNQQVCVLSALSRRGEPPASTDPAHSAMCTTESLTGRSPVLTGNLLPGPLRSLLPMGHTNPATASGRFLSAVIVSRRTVRKRGRAPRGLLDLKGLHHVVSLVLQPDLPWGQRRVVSRTLSEMRGLFHSRNHSISIRRKFHGIGGTRTLGHGIPGGSG